MPYVRKTYTRSYKKGYQPKRSFKKKGKKRFSSKKKFYKTNNLNSLSIRPMVYPRELYVKMKSVQLESTNIALSSSTRRFYLGNSSSFYPPQGALTAFVAPNVVVPAGELYPGGFCEYGSFYDKYRVLGSSITIDGYVTTNSNDSFIRLVFIPIQPSPDGAGDAIEDMINQLDAYDFNQLMAYPQAQYRQAAIQTGGFAHYKFKCFRKTKTMLNIKDVRDQHENLNSDMPTTTGTGGQRPSSTYQWGYYFRAFNDSATTAQNIKQTVTVKSYVNFNQRRYVQAITAA